MSTIVRARSSHNFLGSQGLYSSLLAEQVDTSLKSPYGNQDVSGFFRELGLEVPVHGLEYSHWEESRSNTAIYATGSVGASAGATVTHTVAAAGKYTYGSVSPYTASNDVTTSLPREKTRLLVGGVQCMVLSVNKSANTYTCAPVDETEIVPAVTAAEKIIDLGTGAEEGSGFPDPIAFRPTEFTGQLTFTKEKMSNTDVAAMESLDITLPDGSKVWTFQNWKQLLQGFNNKVDANMMIGKEVTNPTILAAYPELVSGTGYLPYIETFGFVEDYTSGSLSMTDIDNLIKNAANVGAPTEFTGWGGIDALMEFQDLLVDSSGSGANFSFQTFKGKKEMAINLNYNSVYKGGYTFHVRHLGLFTHPELLGAEDLDYKNTIVFAPTSGTTSGKGGERVPHIRVRCLAKEGGGYQGGYEERFRSGINGNTELDESIETFDITARKGIQAFGQKRHMMLKGS